MKVVRILSVRSTDRKGQTLKWFGRIRIRTLISVSIRTALVSGNSKLNFYDPNMMNITTRHKIYCPYPNPIREFIPRKKNYLYLYPQYPFVSDPFSSLVVCLWIGHGCKFANVVWGWLFEAVTCVDVPVLCYWFTIEMFHCRYLMIPNLFPRPTFPFPVKNTWAGMVNVFSQLFLTTFIPNNSLLTRTKTKTQDLPILVKKYRRGE
jgi:hypothetical protein